MLLFLLNLREHMSHIRGQNIDQLVEKWLTKAERATIPHCPAQNTPQHVTSIGVPRLYSIRDGEAKSPDVVGNYAKRNINFLLFSIPVGACRGQRGSVFPSAQFLKFVKKRPENVGLVIGNQAGE